MVTTDKLTEASTPTPTLSWVKFTFPQHATSFHEQHSCWAWSVLCSSKADLVVSPCIRRGSTRTDQLGRHGHRL